jgi:outer membrane protein assembly factor BamA
VLPAYGQSNVSGVSDQESLVAPLQKTTLIIDDIICIGNDNTDCSFIRNKYYQRIGDQLNPDEIIDAKLRLGTLIQFKNIDVFLKKGTKRGNVVVVFDIKEASNLQYELSYDAKRIESKESFYSCYGDSVPDNREALIRLCALDKYHVYETQQYLSTKVTNFNFLGSGKELSLSASGYQYDKEADHFKQSLTELSDTDSWSTRYITTFKRIALNYYDPHLFNSPYYYINANIQLTKNQTKYTETDSNRSETTREAFPSNKRTWFSIGSRFARYSYISLGIAGDLDEKVNENYYLNYGFNSENDILFPVQGEKLTTSYVTLPLGYRYELSYLYHFNIDDNSAISLGVSADYYKESTDNFYSKITEAALLTKYTNFKVINSKEGQYAGWYLGVAVRSKQDRYDNNPRENFKIIEVDVGYTYQTEAMIYRLSLKVGLNESQ